MQDPVQGNYVTCLPTQMPPMCDRVLNYGKEQVHKVSRGQEFSWEGMSQEVHDASIQSDCDIVEREEEDFFNLLANFGAE